MTAGLGVAGVDQLNLLDFSAEPETLARGCLALVGIDCRQSLAVLTEYIQEYQPTNINELCEYLSNMHNPTLCTKGKSETLARLLNGLLIGSSEELVKGVAFDPAKYIGRGKSVVIHTAELELAQQASVVSSVAGKLFAYCADNASDRLQCLLYLDEIAPYCPPIRNTSAKAAIMRIAKQGRKYGLGLLLATQSIGDVDYKALANISTIFAGKVVADTDREKLYKLLSGFTTDARALASGAAAKQTGQFLKVSAGGVDSIKARWLHTKHRPLEPRELSLIMLNRANRELAKLKRRL
jgi:hypothetical protein